MSTITPSIGRKVWYWTTSDSPSEGVLDATQAFDATVQFVDPKTSLVTLTVTTHEGNARVIRDVELLDPGASDHHGPGHDEAYATWMPYQVKAAGVAP